MQETFNGKPSNIQVAVGSPSGSCQEMYICGHHMETQMPVELLGVI